MARPKGSTPARRILQVRLSTGLSSLLIVLVFPFVMLGLLVLVVKLCGLVRYDPACFADEYVEEYSSPPATARALELALRTGNQALLAELQGLRRPARFEMGDAISFVKLWERGGRYVTYLYVDMYSYERHEHHLEQVRGRWVVAPEDVRYYLYSGRWKEVFFPAAIAWWAVGVTALGFVWLLRRSATLRSRLLGR